MMKKAIAAMVLAAVSSISGPVQAAGDLQDAFRRLRRQRLHGGRRALLSRQFRAERRDRRVPERGQTDRRRRTEAQRQADLPGVGGRLQRARRDLGTHGTACALRSGRLVRLCREVRRSDPRRRPPLPDRAVEARDRPRRGRRLQPVPGAASAAGQAVRHRRDQLHRPGGRRSPEPGTALRRRGHAGLAASGNQPDARPGGDGRAPGRLRTPSSSPTARMRSRSSTMATSCRLRRRAGSTSRSTRNPVPTARGGSRSSPTTSLSSR